MRGSSSPGTARGSAAPSDWAAREDDAACLRRLLATGCAQVLLCDVSDAEQVEISQHMCQ